LSEPTLKALTQEFNYTTMSPVQAQVLSLLPTDRDLLVRARTGTGKTLAFVIAALESALHRRQGARFDSSSITILVLSPTRELANQIAEESRRLIRFHGYGVGIAVGGPGRRNNLADLVRRRVDILAATPGRILDYLQNEPDFRAKLAGMETLIFDEADQLLEMGFKDAIADIVSYLPRERQTFMFSATFSEDIKRIAKLTLQPNYNYVDAVPTNETPTHLAVRQTYAIANYHQMLPTLYEVIKQHYASNPLAKVIVFFSTTKIVSYLSSVFNSIPGMDVLEIHSKLSQIERSRVANRFRTATSAVLFTSDVSARGVDYPGVTLVMQLGMPSAREQYIHRIGRTGRAGKTGEGILMLAPFEKTFLTELKDLPIKE
ncbi:P-loop containing nucleoside triphosphate hydrolase protein, partial [Blyttiomyces helicus]